MSCPSWQWHRASRTVVVIKLRRTPALGGSCPQRRLKLAGMPWPTRTIMAIFDFTSQAGNCSASEGSLLHLGLFYLGRVSERGALGDSDASLTLTIFETPRPILASCLDASSTMRLYFFGVVMCADIF